jgi:hypothetical protein
VSGVLFASCGLSFIPFNTSDLNAFPFFRLKQGMVETFAEMTGSIFSGDPTADSKRETLKGQLGSIETDVAKIHSILSSLRDHQV